MSAQETLTLSKPFNLFAKIRDYAEFAKLRLASLVVFSAVTSYLLAANHVDLTQLILLALGGFLVTGASNGFNQVIERDLDKLMARTQNRPLPQGRMGVAEAIVVAITMGIAGIFILWYFMNPLCGIVSTIALLSYTFIYTPLKRVTPFAVFIGAIPGSMPPLLGWIAVSGSITVQPLILFAIQFMWQFPHFWAIAWRLDDDYKKAGFRMLPSAGGRNKASAFQVVVYTVGLIPISLLPYFFHISSGLSWIIVLVAGFVFLYQAIKLYRSLSLEDATRLMFFSFIYLPVVQLSLLIGKL